MEVEDKDTEKKPSKEDVVREMKNQGSNMLENCGLYVGSKFEWTDGVVLDAVVDETKATEKMEKPSVDASSLATRRRPKTAVEVKAEEEQLRKAELEMLDPLREPQTTNDFDRIVLSSPDSSLCWIKYMVFHLQVCVPRRIIAIVTSGVHVNSYTSSTSTFFPEDKRSDRLTGYSERSSVLRHTLLHFFRRV